MKNKVIGFVSVLLIVLGIITSLIRVFMPTESVLENIKLFLGVFTLAFGLFYTVYGYKKDASLFYKIYMFLFAGNALLAMLILVTSGKMGTYTDGIIMGFNMGWCITAGMLAFAQNIGRKLSMAMAITALVLNVLICAYVTATAETPLVGFLNTFQTVVLAFLALVFVLAKYQDKAARGKIE